MSAKNVTSVTKKKLGMKVTSRMTLVFVATAMAITIVGGTALAAVIDGGPGDNTLQGTNIADTINGYEGNDTIYGLEGNDEIDGGDGADTLYGGDADQYLAGKDHLMGRPGNDVIFGGPEADTLWGGQGDDFIYEGPEDDSAADRIAGGLENDFIYAANGQPTADIINCQDGQDEVWVDSVDTVGTDCEIVHRDPSLAEVTFTNPVQVTDVVQLSTRYDSDVEMLTSEFQAGVPMMDGYEPTATTSAGMAQAFEEQRLASFQDMVESMEQMPPEDRTEVQPQIDAMKSALARNDAGQITVSEATFTGDLKDLQALEEESAGSAEADSTVETVAIATTQEIAEHAQSTEEDAPETDATTTEESLETLAPPGTVVEETTVEEPESGSGDGAYTLEGGTFWPNKGFSDVRRSRGDTSRRASYQGFKWNNKCCFGGVPSNGYEHDFKLSLSDGITYLSGYLKDPNRRGGLNCMPKGAYWNTDLPRSARPYLDSNRTPSGCEKRWRTFTVGILDPGDARSGRWYHTYISTPPGKDSVDAAVLQAERTRRVPCMGQPRTFCATGGGGQVSLPDKNTAPHNGEKKAFSVPSFRRWVE